MSTGWPRQAEARLAFDPATESVVVGYLPIFWGTLNEKQVREYFWQTFDDFVQRKQ